MKNRNIEGTSISQFNFRQNTSVGDHPGTIPVEFSQIPISRSREDVVWTFPYIIQSKTVTPGERSILTPGA